MLRSLEIIHWVMRRHGEVEMWTDVGSDGGKFGLFPHVARFKYQSFMIHVALAPCFFP